MAKVQQQSKLSPTFRYSVVDQSDTFKHSSLSMINNHIWLKFMSFAIPYRFVVDHTHIWRAVTMLYYYVCHSKPVELCRTTRCLPPIMGTKSRTRIFAVVTGFGCVLIVVSYHVLQFKWRIISHWSHFDKGHSHQLGASRSEPPYPRDFTSLHCWNSRFTAEPAHKILLLEL